MEEGFTVEQLFWTLTGPDRVRLIREKEVVADNYQGLIPKEFNAEIVKRVRCIPELRHKRQKELNLDPPLHPEDTPAYSFSDLEMRLYYDIYI